jgi:hypothetical protein
MSGSYCEARMRGALKVVGPTPRRPDWRSTQDGEERFCQDLASRKSRSLKHIWLSDITG